MTLSVEVVSAPVADGIDAECLARFVEAVADGEPQIPAGPWSMTVRLCDDQEIADLHLAFFNDPAPTDVITFPDGDISDGSGHLGDIVVSIETARRQGAEVGHSLAREVTFLAIHGLLHLCGYRDSTQALRGAMLARQEHLLHDAEERLGVRL